MTDTLAPLVDTLRRAVPYINTYQSQTFVILLTDTALDSPSYPGIIDDIGLLHRLGIRLVLVYGMQCQIDRALAQQQIRPYYHNAIRITSKRILDVIKQTAGALQFDISARLAMGLGNLPLAAAPISVVSGNFILAQPFGIYEGIDYCYTGKIRRIHTKRILAQLSHNNLVLISPISVSITGECFNLCSDQIAAAIAVAIKADKLITFWNSDQSSLSVLHPDAAERLVAELPLDCNRQLLHMMVKAVRDGSVQGHLIRHTRRDALVQELFTDQPTGIRISRYHNEWIRFGTIKDVTAILRLIKPLEKEGVLIQRSHAQIEEAICRFIVIEHDTMLIGCALLNLYPAEKMAEMACVAVHPKYRNASRGDQLLQKIIAISRQKQLDRIFALTTQSLHWFLERGFVVADIADLPREKRNNYNYARNPKVLMLTLNTDKSAKFDE